MKEWIMEQLGGEPLRKENRLMHTSGVDVCCGMFEREREGRIAHTDQWGTQMIWMRRGQRLEGTQPCRPW